MYDQILEESSSLQPKAEVEVTITTSECKSPLIDVKGIEENGRVSPLPALPPDLPPLALPAGLPLASTPPAPFTSWAPLPPRSPLPNGAPLPSPMVFDPTQPPPLQRTARLVPFIMGKTKKKVDGNHGKKSFSFCHDYLNSICTRKSCSFYHGNLKEEEYYKNFGILPSMNITTTTPSALRSLGKRPGDPIPLRPMDLSVPQPSLPTEKDEFVSNGDNAYKHRAEFLPLVHPGIMPSVIHGGTYDLPESNPGLVAPSPQIRIRSLGTYDLPESNPGLVAPSPQIRIRSLGTYDLPESNPGLVAPSPQIRIRSLGTYDLPESNPGLVAPSPQIRERCLGTYDLPESNPGLVAPSPQIRERSLGKYDLPESNPGLVAPSPQIRGRSLGTYDLPESNPGLVAPSPQIRGRSLGTYDLPESNPGLVAPSPQIRGRSLGTYDLPESNPGLVAPSPQIRGRSLGTYDLPESNPGLVAPSPRERSLLRDQVEQVNITTLLDEIRVLRRQLRQRDAVIEHMSRYFMRYVDDGISDELCSMVGIKLALAEPATPQHTTAGPQQMVPPVEPQCSNSSCACCPRRYNSS